MSIHPLLGRLAAGWTDPARAQHHPRLMSSDSGVVEVPAGRYEVLRYTSARPDIPEVVRFHVGKHAQETDANWGELLDGGNALILAEFAIGVCWWTALIDLAGPVATWSMRCTEARIYILRAFAAPKGGKVRIQASADAFSPEPARGTLTRVIAIPAGAGGYGFTVPAFARRVRILSPAAALPVHLEWRDTIGNVVVTHEVPIGATGGDAYAVPGGAETVLVTHAAPGATRVALVWELEL